MNDNRKPNGRDQNRRGDRNAPRRADRFAERTVVEEVEGQLEGRNALTEALKSGRTIDKVFVAAGDTDRSLQRLAAQAKEAGAVVVPVDRRKLDAMSTTRSHQGVIALAAAHDYFTIDDLLEEAASRGENALIVICDELSDPHNLGAIMRTAECAGAHGLITPLKNSAPVNAEAIRSSAGALTTIPVCRVGSIRNTVKQLQLEGFQIVAATEKSRKLLYDADLRKPTVIIMGSEDTGISKEVLKLCDEQLAIPLIGHIESLNVSAAAAVILFEVVRQRIEQ